MRCYTGEMTQKCVVFVFSKVNCFSTVSGPVFNRFRTVGPAVKNAYFGGLFYFEVAGLMGTVP